MDDKIRLGRGTAMITVAFLLAALTAYPARGQTVSQPTPAEIIRQLHEQTAPRTAVPFDPKEFDKFAGYYQLQPTVFFHVFRNGDHYFAQLSGQGPVEWFPESSTKFFAATEAAQISFLEDPDGRTTGLILHQNGYLRPATKVADVVAEAAAEELQLRITNNTPGRGTEAALRHQIETIQRGEPDYDAMGPGLAKATHEQLQQLTQLMQGMGRLRAVIFKRVLPNGADVYLATFTHGRLECTISPLSSDGKIEGDYYHYIP
jgi:Domain of unknown function (DUF3471)